MSYISSTSISLSMRSSVLNLQSQLAQTQTEISSGVSSDLGLALGARSGTSVSLKNETDVLTSYSNTNALATTRLGATSTALDSMLSAAQSMSASLVTAASAGGSTTALTPTATSNLQALIAGLNTSAGGQYVFAGLKTDTQPIADYFSTTTSAAKTAVDTAFQSQFGISQTSAGASAITGPQMTDFLNNQFAPLFSDSKWSGTSGQPATTGTWSSASSQTIASSISTSQSTTTSVSANESAFQSLAQGYTMLTEFTGTNMSADARAAVVTKAQTLISAGIAGLTSAQSAVGTAQAAIAAADTQNAAQVTVLKTSVSSLEGVDTYALSTKLTTLQTQLQSSYEITNSLAKLSLVNYFTNG